MIPKKSNFKTRQLVACALLAGFAAAGALAGTTDIANVPLATGTPLPPNVLFTLDNSGSMDWDFLPDHIDPNISNGTSPSNPCMTEAGGSTSAKCTRGDPPHEAGGQNGSNGVSYDPTLRYLPGITSTGALKLNPSATPPGSLAPFTSVPNDAYGATSGNANLVTGASVIGSIDAGTPVSAAFDKAYCNASNATANASKACKRPGVDIGGTVLTPSGTRDPENNSMGAGQFPYRANVSSGSNRAFGMPEMMTTASFARSGTTVTATTAGKPGLSVGDLVWVSATTTSVNATCVAVTAVTATTFTYTSSNGTVAANTGSYRRCGTGSWTRSGSTITVTITSANDQLKSNDLLIIAVPSNTNQNKTTATAVSVTPLVGSDYGTTFTYTGSNSGSSLGADLVWVRTGLYNFSTPLTASPALVATVPPVAYTITPIEYCSDINLTTCQEVIPPAAPPSGFFPAYVRFCKTQADAVAMGAVTGTSGAPASARCQAKYTNPTAPLYQFPRYGRFNRESIVNDGRTFANRPNRTDCTAVGTAGTCNWTEEMQNIANWYTYYRTRMQMMKTATGRAFQQFVSNPAGSPPRPDTLRVGYITINSPTSSNNYLRINNFNPTQASSWYTALYAANPGSGTPLKTALSRAGWIFAGKMNTGLTSGIPAADDPIQASCQRNYSILTTDGFWNASAAAGQTLGAANIGNVDNVQSPAGVDQLVSQSDGTWDGGISGASGTLADVAQYYYQTDLRNAGAGPLTSPNSVPTANQDVSLNNVPTKSGNKDFLTTQHMVTYTLGMADGLMRYQPDYDTATSGDFFNIKNGTVGACFWMPANTACAWPAPVGDTPSALDDLWHAAVNGRGTFYQALNAAALATSLSNALGNLNAQTAAAAASATSSPNITQTDNQIFSTTYQTNTWSGKIFAQTIDPVTGNVNPGILWQADTQMSLITGPQSDSRHIKTPNPNLGGLMDFTFANIAANATAANEANFFQNRCTAGVLSQCGAMPAGDKPVADSGANLVNFLRGQSVNEASPSCTRNLVGIPPTACVFRDRQEVDPISNAVTQTVIGDTISAKPVFVRAPIFDYGGTYDAFKASLSSRAPRLYVGANDGYLHNFDANTGNEVWAYAPRFLLPALYRLADTAYSANHQFFVDGSPETGDVQDSSGNWKTILVGGVAGGGRGWYALDITDPNNPLFLWEFCADATLCAKTDPDIGFSFGNPVIGKRPDGKWVVVLSSGLNNVPPPSPTTLAGNGGGYFYVLDANTGQVLTKSPTLLSGTNPGTTTTPSGLMKISGYFDNPVKDATFDFVYGGDQLGNVWRMDMPLDSSTPNVLHLATLQDTAGRKQPITTRMALTHIGTNRVFYVGTGRYLGTSDLSDPGVASGIAWQQSIYAIKDKVVTAAGDYGNIRNANLVQQTLINASATTRTTTNIAVDWNAKDGWFIDLNPGNTTPGERVNVDPELIIGTLVIASNIPTTSAACTVGGESFLYQFDFKTGQYIANSLNNVAGTMLGGITVGMAVVQLPSGVIKDIVTTADTSKTSQGVNIGAATAILRRFSYRER